MGLWVRPRSGEGVGPDDVAVKAEIEKLTSVVVLKLGVQVPDGAFVVAIEGGEQYVRH